MALRLSLTLLLALLGTSDLLHASMWPQKIYVYRGATPTLDGVIAPGEYIDATRLDHTRDWTPQYDPVTLSADLDASAWIKHDSHDTSTSPSTSPTISSTASTPSAGCPRKIPAPTS